MWGLPQTIYTWLCPMPWRHVIHPTSCFLSPHSPSLPLKGALDWEFCIICCGFRSKEVKEFFWTFFFWIRISFASIFHQLQRKDLLFQLHLSPPNREVMCGFPPTFPKQLLLNAVPSSWRQKTVFASIIHFFEPSFHPCSYQCCCL